jgi:hypothetical protein
VTPNFAVLVSKIERNPRCDGTVAKVSLAEGHAVFADQPRDVPFRDVPGGHAVPDLGHTCVVDEIGAKVDAEARLGTTGTVRHGIHVAGKLITL